MQIKQSNADVITDLQKFRLSWHLTGIDGGWTLGTLTAINNNLYLKHIFLR